MSSCVSEHRVVTSPIAISLTIMRIQTEIFKLSSEVPYIEDFQILHDRLVDASIALSSASFFLKVPEND